MIVGLFVRAVSYCGQTVLMCLVRFAEPTVRRVVFSRCRKKKGPNELSNYANINNSSAKTPLLEEKKDLYSTVCCAWYSRLFS